MRLAATEEMIKTIESLQTTDALVPYLDDFFGLMLNLMNDVNFKIYINSLNTIGIVIKLTSKNDLAPHIDRVVEALLGKLGDSKVAARQIAFQILAIAAKVKYSFRLNVLNSHRKSTLRIISGWSLKI